MKLTVREAAGVLNVSETKIYRWVDDDEIPFVMIHHHPMFHRVELLEWAMATELPLGVDLGDDGRDQPLARALERGAGQVGRGSLAELAADLPIHSAAERDVIRSIIAARRGELFANRPADWIALPKARSPIISPETEPTVVLWWWGQDALDINDLPTNAVFLIIAPTIKQHLHLLSRLSLALHDAAFRGAVQRKSDFDQVVAEARRWEQALAGAAR